MVRDVLSVVFGMFVGGLANLVVVFGSTLLWPLPEGFDPADAEAFAAYVATLPSAAFVLVMVAHLSQAFFGGGVAAFLAASPRRAALVVGGLSMLGGLANLLTLPGPLWLWLEVPLYLVMAHLAANLVIPLRPARSAQS